MGVTQEILDILSLASGTLQGVLTGDAQKADVIAANLIKIAQKAASAYQSHTGQAIDPTQLQPIDKV